MISLSFTDFCFFGDSLGFFGALSTFLIFLLWLVLLPRIFRGEFKLGIKDTSVRLLGLFIVICGLSIFLSAQAPTEVWSAKSPWSLSMRQFIQLTWGVSVALLTIHFVRTWKDFRLALQCFFIGFVFAASASLLDTYNFYYGTSLGLEFGQFLNTFGLDASYYPALRFRLLSPEPSMAANYLVTFMPFLFFGAYYWKRTLWSVCFAGLSGLLLVGTFSLGGFVTFSAEVLLALVLLQRRALGKILVGIALPVAILVLAYPSQALEFSERLLGLMGSSRYSSDLSARMRAAQVETAYNTFLDHPIVGVGIGNEISYVVQEYPGWAARDPITSQMIKIDNTAAMASNNLAVQILAENGIVGALVFGLFLASMLRDCLRLMNSTKEPWKKAVYISIFLALAGQIVHYMALSGLYFRYWYLIWGLAISAKYLNSQTDPLFVKSPNAVRRRVAAPVKNLTGRTSVGEQKRGIPINSRHIIPR